MIRLSVPGTLHFRDVAIRVVASACKLLTGGDHGGAAPREAASGPATEEFDAQVVSAFGEAFNNIAIHGYRGVTPGEVSVEIEADAGRFVIRIRDHGATYQFPDEVAAPEALPERGMGLFIIRSFMDEVVYEPGPPNVLTMSKRWPDPGRREESIPRDPGGGGGARQ